jgi:hypothetical protein
MVGLSPVDWAADACCVLYTRSSCASCKQALPGMVSNRVLQEPSGGFSPVPGAIRYGRIA